MTLSFVVFGTPAPQGSKNVNKHGAVYESSKAVKPWREAVRLAAVEAKGMNWTPFTGQVQLEVNFHFQRPKGHYGTGRNSARVKPSAPRAPLGPPDLSKLIRSTEDALTEAGIWRDDSVVVAIRADKFYNDHGFYGANISVTQFTGGPE